MASVKNSDDSAEKKFWMTILRVAFANQSKKRFHGIAYVLPQYRAATIIKIPDHAIKFELSFITELYQELQIVIDLCRPRYSQTIVMWCRCMMYGSTVLTTSKNYMALQETKRFTALWLYCRMPVCSLSSISNILGYCKLVWSKSSKDVHHSFLLSPTAYQINFAAYFTQKLNI